MVKQNYLKRCSNQTNLGSGQSVISHLISVCISVCINLEPSLESKVLETLSLNGDKGLLNKYLFNNVLCFQKLSSVSKA